MNLYPRNSIWNWKHFRRIQCCCRKIWYSSINSKYWYCATTVLSQFIRSTLLRTHRVLDLVLASPGMVVRMDGPDGPHCLYSQSAKPLHVSWRHINKADGKRARKANVRLRHKPGPRPPWLPCSGSRTLVKNDNLPPRPLLALSLALPVMLFSRARFYDLNTLVH
jgi:hypothetical protein